MTYFPCSSLRSFTSWPRTSSSPTWVWLCSPSRITSSTPSSSSAPSYPFEARQTNRQAFCDGILIFFAPPSLPPPPPAVELGHCGGFVCYLRRPKRQSNHQIIHVAVYEFSRDSGCIYPALICFVEDFLTCRPSDRHISWKSFEYLPAVLPPQPRQAAQDQGQLPAHDDVRRCGG